MALDPSLLRHGFADRFALAPSIDYLNHGSFFDPLQAQAYNSLAQYERLARLLPIELARAS
jgi:hypothetical protein